MSRSQWQTIALCALLLSLANYSPAPVAQERAQTVALAQVQIDASQVKPVYGNFSRVTTTTEEVILDFGLNDQAQGVPSKPIRIDARLVLNFYTAKRLIGALNLALERHEKAFGPVEVDVRKRLLQPT